MHEREGPPRARIPKCAARRYSSDRADTALTLPLSRERARECFGASVWKWNSDPYGREGFGKSWCDQNVLLMPAEIQRAENGSMPALPLPNARQPERCR